MGREKASKNQQHVAEALHQAREHGFIAGLRFLTDNLSDQHEISVLKGWFMNKCTEHNIPNPGMPYIGPNGEFEKVV